MKKRIGQQAVIGFVIALMMVFAVGCALFNTPQKKPDTPAPQKQAVQGTEPDIVVYMHETGEKKTMKMEDYLAGVVAGEMKTDWPEEALAAQAILARTFTIKTIEEKGGVPERNAQASTDIKEFQAYDDKAITDKVRNAVKMTRGMIITYNQQPIYAWFHASAGGITATAKEGLDFKEMEPPYIQSVQSPDDAAPEDVKNWTATFTQKEILDVLAKLGKSVDKVDSIAIGEKGPSGRAVSFNINNSVQVSAPEMRIALGSTKLKSLLLDKVEVVPDGVAFTGKGYGHGVGMSQWGAYQMATAMGKKYQDIIGYYFKGVTIEKRYE